jgi:hypothetical protein
MMACLLAEAAQIVVAREQGEVGVPSAEPTRKVGISGSYTSIIAPKSPVLWPDGPVVRKRCDFGTEEMATDNQAE